MAVSLFRLDASIRREGSRSREIADIVEREWRETHPDAPIVRRHIGVEPIPATAWAAANEASARAEDEWTPEQREAVGLATAAGDQLVAADALLFAVPIYNFGVSQHFKAWVDLVLTQRRMAAGSDTLAGKPAVLVLVRGGNYSPGTPREGWDHATGWIRRILEDVWRLDLRVVENEFTLVGVVPELDQFKELAANLRAEAERAARDHGRTLASALVAKQAG